MWGNSKQNMLSVSPRLDGNYYRSTAILNVVVSIVSPQGSCMCVEIFNFSLTVWLYGAWLFSICYTPLILGSKQIQLSHFSLLFYGELHMESMNYKRFGPNRHMDFMRPWGLGKPAQSCWKWKTESNSNLLHVGHGPFLGGAGYSSLPLILPTCGIKTKVWLACLQFKQTNYPQPVKTLPRNVKTHPSGSLLWRFQLGLAVTYF